MTIQNLVNAFLLLPIIAAKPNPTFNRLGSIPSISSTFNSSSFKATCPSEIEGCKISNTCTYCPDSCQYCQCTSCGSSYSMCTENNCVSCNDGYSLNIKDEIDITGSCELKSDEDPLITDEDDGPINDPETVSFWLVITSAIFAFCTCCITITVMVCRRKKFLNQEMNEFHSPLILKNHYNKHKNKNSAKVRNYQKRPYDKFKSFRHKEVCSDEAELGDTLSSLSYIMEDCESDTKTNDDNTSNDTASIQNPITMMNLYGASDDNTSNNSEQTMNTNGSNYNYKLNYLGVKGRKSRHVAHPTSSVEFEYGVDLIYEPENTRDRQPRAVPTYQSLLPGSSIDDEDYNLVVL